MRKFMLLAIIAISTVRCESDESLFTKVPVHLMPEKMQEATLQKANEKLNAECGFAWHDMAPNSEYLPDSIKNQKSGKDKTCKFWLAVANTLKNRTQKEKLSPEAQLEFEKLLLSIAKFEEKK